jgi:peptidoglycan/xylan/chitin deacetylase (PgdA/CDA1 family)
MRPERDLVPRAKEAWLWLSGLLLLGVLGAGATGAAVLLWENIDIRQLTPGLAEIVGSPPEPDMPTPPVVAAFSFDAVLFVSPRNRTFVPDTTFYPDELERWRHLVADVGGRVRLAETADDLRALSSTDMLLMPEAPCLTTAELAAVSRHVGTGGSLVTNWAVGARDENCDWRGWEPLLDLTGAEDVRESPSRQALYLTIPAGLSVSVGVDPGTRVELRPDRSVALKMAGPHVYWSDWALNPTPDFDGAGADAAVSTTETDGGGRVAWFGLRLGQAATPRDSVLVERMVQNGVLWAAGVPTVAPSPWPGAARAAVVFTLDVEAEHRNALGVAEVLAAEGLTASFFVVSQIVREDGELAEALARVGEVGTQTVDHTPIAGLTPQDQRVRLQRAADEIERWTGIAPVGLHPPEEAHDSASLVAWKRAGGRYILGGTEARSGSPELHTVLGGSMVVLPRVIKDDYGVFVQGGAVRATRLSDAYVKGAHKMRAIGGLAVIAGHTQIMSRGTRLDALRVVADSVRSQGDWWITRADHVAEWWSARGEVRMSWVDSAPLPAVDGIQSSELPDLLVHGGSTEMKGLWIDVVVPGSDRLLPLLDGETVEFKTTEWGMQLPVGVLRPGESRRIAFVWVEEG